MRNNKNQKLGKRKQKRVIAKALGIKDAEGTKHKYQNIDNMNAETFAVLKDDHKVFLKGLNEKV